MNEVKTKEQQVRGGAEDFLVIAELSE